MVIERHGAELEALLSHDLVFYGARKRDLIPGFSLGVALALTARRGSWGMPCILGGYWARSRTF